VSTWSPAIHESSLNNLSLFAGFFDPKDFPRVPISQDHVKKLVDDLGFPDRFFVDLMVRRRLSIRTTTRTGDSWLMCDSLFSAVTLKRTGTNDLLSIIVSGNKHKYEYSNMEPVLERYISSKFFHRHPLFPICLIADAALEDYRVVSNDVLARSRDLDRFFGITFQNRAIFGDTSYEEDPAAGLANIAGERESLARLSGDLKTFCASLQNLLNLYDESNGSSGNSGSPQSVSAQVGGQLITSLSSMLQYLISASGDILEEITTTDTGLQTLFPLVSV
jgi:hypothetical protein